MKYIKATEKDLEQIVNLVQETIKAIYPKYYPKEVVDFFCELHCRENILKDIEAGLVGILKKDDEILGTGCYKENHITRVYVKPIFQKQGYGSYIMQCLENEIRMQHETVYLDASLPASHLYEKLGYKTKKHERWNVENGVILVYEVMEKKLSMLNSMDITTLCEKIDLQPQIKNQVLSFVKEFDFETVDKQQKGYLVYENMKEALAKTLQNRFEIFDRGEEETEFLEWVFNTKSTDYNNLPEKTSLQKKMKKHLLEGGTIRNTYGRLK